MDPTDSSRGAVSLHPTWKALGHRAAVVAGTGTALVALLGDVPVRVASLRGALVWLVVVVLFRAGGALLERVAAREPAAARAGEGHESEG